MNPQGRSAGGFELFALELLRATRFNSRRSAELEGITKRDGSRVPRRVTFGTRSRSRGSRCPSPDQPSGVRRAVQFALISGIEPSSRNLTLGAIAHRRVQRTETPAAALVTRPLLRRTRQSQGRRRRCSGADRSSPIVEAGCLEGCSTLNVSTCTVRAGVAAYRNRCSPPSQGFRQATRRLAGDVGP